MGKQPKRGGRQKFSAGPADDDEEDKVKDVPASRGLGGQSATAGMMPPSDSEEEESEEEVAPPKKGGQNANAGMMPPDDDEDDEDDEDDDDDEEDPNWAECMRLAEQLLKTFKKLDKDDRQEFLKEVLFDKFRKVHEKLEKEKAPAAVELTRKEREQLEAQKEPEVTAEQDKANRAKLAEVQKRRAEQAKKRVEADGWDRYAPLTETNRPPGSAWPPPDQAAA